MPAPFRLLRRSSVIGFAVVLGLTGVTACGGGDGTSASDKAPDTTVATVGGVRSGTRPQTTDPIGNDGPAGTFESQVIETPSSLLAATSTVPSGFTLSPADTAIVAQATAPAVAVFPGASDAKPFTTLKNPLPSGAQLTFLVDGQTPQRAKVLLPIRPNGKTGWVNLSEVRLVRNDFKVVVELAEFRILAFQGTRTILDAPIGIGTSETPTPGGRYYIKELLRPPNPDTVYGVYAYGLSGFSEVITNFNGGDGVLGIHGTNRPDLLGKRVSHGCIRMRNEDITKLAKVLPLGTPVIVKA